VSLTLAVAAIVSDCLAWLSEGVFHLMPLGDLWSRLDFGSFDRVQRSLQATLDGKPWSLVALPVLSLPALPVFAVAGVVLIWFGRRTGRVAEPRFVGGSRPPRRRRRPLS
jgi:hypothetical protein